MSLLDRLTFGCAFGLALHLAVACHHREVATDSASQSLTSSATPVAASPPPTPLDEGPKGRRVVAVGDLHGDLAAARRVFQLVGASDDQGHWRGGNLVLVQTGDLLDRGSNERELLEWLQQLESEAKAAGGALLVLNGNHEIMNVAGDFRYVTGPGFADFASERSPAPGAALERLPAEARGRAAAFFPGGRWARWLAAHPVVLRVDDTLFVHGGLRLAHVTYGLSRINREIAAWMWGTAALPAALGSDDSPYWIRDYGGELSEADCAGLEQMLAAAAAKRLVVGHTPQKTGVTEACGGKVVRIDVGLSAYYGPHAPEAIELKQGKLQILRAP